jgi:DNA replication initiation complex subunit (GINS family)
MQAPMMDKTDVKVEVEPELYYEVEEEMKSVKDKMWGLDSIKSTDGHTFRVERDVSKNCINILFDDDMEAPFDHKTDRPVSKAVKRAQQRLLMEEELLEFKMSQYMQHTVPKLTETIIMKVVRRACQKQLTRTMSATPTPEAPAKPKDHSDNHNCGEDEDH